MRLSALAALAAIALILAAQPAAACHRYHVWRYHWPQACRGDQAGPARHVRVAAHSIRHRRSYLAQFTPLARDADLSPRTSPPVPASAPVVHEDCAIVRKEPAAGFDLDRALGVDELRKKMGAGQ